MGICNKYVIKVSKHNNTYFDIFNALADGDDDLMVVIG
tara:strand:+ start:12184 stop:12297 length:114 start_codon:yes stop_codon:yes gene_type:complete